MGSRRFPGPRLRFGLAGVAVLVMAGCAAPDSTPTALPTQTVAPTTPAQPTRGTTPEATASPARPDSTPTPLRTPTVVPTTPAEPTRGTTPTATPSPTRTVYLPPEFPKARYGGVLRRDITSDPPGFDIVRERTDPSMSVLSLAYDQLVEAEPHNSVNYVPQLAEGWTVSGDGTVVTFSLRPGVKFHNGSVLNAEDIKFSYDIRQTPPKGVPSSFKDMLGSVTATEVVNELTVRLRLSVPDAALIASLGFGQMTIYNKEYVEANGIDRMTRWPPMGSGPYMGLEGGFLRGVSVELVRNPAYFVKGRPFLDGHKLFIIPDAGTSVATLISGVIDLSDRIYTPRQTAEMKARLGDRVVIQERLSAVAARLDLPLSIKPFDDIRVREALTLAMDRRALINTLGDGGGGIGGSFPPGTWWDLPKSELIKFAGYAAAFGQRDRAEDLARARRLLAEAGFPNGFATTALVRNIPQYVDLNIIVQNNLGEIGVTMKMDIVDNVRYAELRARREGYNLLPQLTAIKGMDPNQVYREHYLPDGVLNLPRIDNKTINDLFKRQSGMVDADARRQLVWDMEREALGMYTHNWLYWNGANYAFWAHVKNYDWHPSRTANKQHRDTWIDRG